MINKFLNLFGYEVRKLGKLSGMEDIQSIEKRIRILMIKRGITITDLIKKLKKTQPAISNAISGRRPQLQREIYNYLKSIN